MRYQYSTDGGSTWRYITAINAAVETTDFPPLTATGSTTELTNLNQLQFRTIVMARLGDYMRGSGVETDSTIDSASATY